MRGTNKAGLMMLAALLALAACDKSKPLGQNELDIANGTAPIEGTISDMSAIETPASDGDAVSETEGNEAR